MRSSSKIFLMAGSLFALVGFVFVIVFFVITANLDEVMRHARGDAWLIQPMFGIMGFMCLIIGIVILRWYFKSTRIKRRLLAQNDYVMADIVGFPVDYQMRVNRMLTYHIECCYKDPVTGTLHMFQSENLLIDPAYVTDVNTVRVYVDRASNYKYYYVDAESILPNSVWH